MGGLPSGEVHSKSQGNMAGVLSTAVGAKFLLGLPQRCMVPSPQDAHVQHSSPLPCSKDAFCSTKGHRQVLPRAPGVARNGFFQAERTVFSAC